MSTHSHRRVGSKRRECQLSIIDTGEGVEKFKSDPFWKELKAVKNNRVYTFDYYGLVNAGSVGAIEQACKQLQQEILAQKAQ